MGEGGNLFKRNCIVQLKISLRMTQKQGAKPFDIDRWKLYYAYQRVNQNRGGSGVDNVTLEKYNSNLKRNLYKLWNRMSSGSYVPQPVRLVQIPFVADL